MRHVQIRFYIESKGEKPESCLQQVQPQTDRETPNNSNVVQRKKNRATSMEAPQTRTSVPQLAPNELPTLDLLHEGIIAKGVTIRVENGHKYSRSDLFCFLFLSVHFRIYGISFPYLRK